jgi:hypothetical protein
MFVASIFLVRANFDLVSILMILIVAWYFCVFLYWGGLNSTGVNRLMVIVLYGFIFWISQGLVRGLDDWFDFLVRVFWLGTLYLLAVNIIFQPTFENLLDPQFVRYEGASGPNYHGITAALTLMAGLSVGIKFRKPLYLFYFLPAAINLWLTGSRAALLTFLLFIFVVTAFRAKILFLALLIPTALLAWIAINDPNIMTGIRFDEVSVNSRIQGVEWAHGMITQAGGAPFGLGVLAQEAKSHTLDNSFLTITLESGIIGLVLLLCLSAISIIKLLASEYRLKHMKIKASYTPGAFLIALLFHGLFESYIWSGFELGMAIMLVALSYLARVDAQNHEIRHQLIKTKGA